MMKRLKQPQRTEFVGKHFWPKPNYVLDISAESASERYEVGAAKLLSLPLPPAPRSN